MRPGGGVAFAGNHPVLSSSSAPRHESRDGYSTNGPSQLRTPTPLHKLLQICWHHNSAETNTIRIYEVSFHRTQKQGQQLSCKKEKEGTERKGRGMGQEKDVALVIERYGSTLQLKMCFPEMLFACT